MSEQSETTEQEAEVNETVRVTGLTASVVALFLLLRVLAVSDWNWNTAAEVLETINVDDSITILFGTLFAVPEVAGILVALLLPLAATNLVRLRLKSEWNLGKVVLVIALAVTAITLIGTFGYWWLPVATLATCAVIAAHTVLRRKQKDAVLGAARKVGVIAIFGLLLMAATNRTPWVPEERITTRSDGELVGYVLDGESNFLKVLTAKDRELVIVATTDVESRTSFHP